MRSNLILRSLNFPAFIYAKSKRSLASASKYWQLLLAIYKYFSNYTYSPGSIQSKLAYIIVIIQWRGFLNSWLTNDIIFDFSLLWSANSLIYLIYKYLFFYYYLYETSLDVITILGYPL